MTCALQTAIDPPTESKTMITTTEATQSSAQLQPHVADPCVMVIFGASGDLTKRKLLPALCNLAQDNLLPEQFAIVGFATNDYTTESFRKMLGEEIPKYAPAPVDLKFWDGIAERIYYVRGDFQDTEAFRRLQEQIEQADRLHNTLGNRFFYLAVAPRFFSPIVKK